MTHNEEDANSYFDRANAKHDKGDLDGAIADYSEAIRLDPDYAAAYYNRGNAKDDKGDFDGAIADFTEAIRLKPDHADAYYNRGWAKHNRKSDLNGAIADYSEAIRLKPTDATTYNNRGNAKDDKGDFNGAIADYSEAIRLDPDYAAAYFNRGNTKKKKGDQGGAIADYTEAIRLKPDEAAAYFNRSGLWLAQGNGENHIADWAKYWDLSGSIPSFQDDENGHFIATDQHLAGILRPRIKNAGERYAWHLPCELVWGRKNTVERRLDGTAHNAQVGRFGTGYICLTDKSLWLVSLIELTKKYSTRKEESPLSLIGFLNFVARDVNDMTAETEDKMWHVPWESIAAIQPSTDTKSGEDFIRIVSGPNWEIHPYMDLCLAALNMGKSGKLARIWSEESVSNTGSTSAGSSSSHNDILDSLKKLDELRHAGILTDTEFEAKKQELLKRL